MIFEEAQQRIQQGLFNIDDLNSFKGEDRALLLGEYHAWLKSSRKR